jgi:elongator complex protein 3
VLPYLPDPIGPGVTRRSTSPSRARAIFACEKGMPRSYLADEPGCQRAAANRFDPYLQTWNRLLAFRRMGHPTAKIELILLGGTWSFYPEAYQVWFVRRCLEALNDFGAGRDGRDQAGEEGSSASPASSSPPDWEALEGAQRENETSGSRCVGLALETRPDHVDAEEALRIRRLGGTKVQIGLQSLSDEVLRRNRRGHDVAASRRALRLLRGAGFKLHVHWMPNLYGSSPPPISRTSIGSSGSGLPARRDQRSIPAAWFTAWARAALPGGAWRSTQARAPGGALRCLRRISEYAGSPGWFATSPPTRSWPGTSSAISADLATARLAEQGWRAATSAREIRDRSCDPERLSLRSTGYDTSLGREEFLELVTPEDRLAAFLRSRSRRAERAR